jgi:hypothetical protein
MINKIILQKIIKDRQFLMVWLIMIVGILLSVILTLFQLRSSELNIAVRYTAYGPTHIYNDSWYYLLTFIAFFIGIGVLHSLIAAKLFERRGVGVAKLFLGLSIIIVLITSIQVSHVMSQAMLSS